MTSSGADPGTGGSRPVPAAGRVWARPRPDPGHHRDHRHRRRSCCRPALRGRAQRRHAAVHPAHVAGATRTVRVATVLVVLVLAGTTVGIVWQNGFVDGTAYGLMIAFIAVVSPVIIAQPHHPTRDDHPAHGCRRTLPLSPGRSLLRHRLRARLTAAGRRLLRPDRPRQLDRLHLFQLHHPDHDRLRRLHGGLSPGADAGGDRGALRPALPRLRRRAAHRQHRPEPSPGRPRRQRCPTSWRRSARWPTLRRWSRPDRP